MKFIKISIFILSCLFCSYIFPDGEIIIPSGTRLVKQNSDSVNTSKKSESIYVSRLSKKNIIGFYQKHLGQQGFEEKVASMRLKRKPPKAVKRREKNVFMFYRQADQTYIELIFLEQQEGETKYKLNTVKFKNTIVDNSSDCQGSNCKYKEGSSADTYYLSKDKSKESSIPIRLAEPKNTDFIPMLSNVKQLEYIDWSNNQPPMISIGYLSRQDATVIINFYLEKMPSYGWELIDNQSHQGTYSVGEWIPMVAPYTSLQKNYKKVLPYSVPLLKLRGATLTFVNSSQKCILTIYTFDDIISQANQQAIYDLQFMEDNGTTIIGVAYFYEGA